MEIKSLVSNEVSKPSVFDSKAFDPDKKIDVNRKPEAKESSGFEVDKRVDITEKPKIEKLDCINEKYVGDICPRSEIRYERKVVDLGDRKVEGVFPVFDSDIDIQLPKELYSESNYRQFKECNQQLRDAIIKDPKLKEKFSPDQVEQIMDGETPDGKVWHHNEELGKMQLVDFDKHEDTPHTGGKSIWGGGYGHGKE